MIESSKTKSKRRVAPTSELRVILRAVLPFFVLVVAIYAITNGLQRRRNNFGMRNNDVRMYAMLGSPMGGRGGKNRERDPQPKLDIKNMEQIGRAHV